MDPTAQNLCLVAILKTEFEIEPCAVVFLAMVNLIDCSQFPKVALLSKAPSFLPWGEQHRQPTKVRQLIFELRISGTSEAKPLCHVQSSNTGVRFPQFAKLYDILHTQHLPCTLKITDPDKRHQKPQTLYSVLVQYWWSTTIWLGDIEGADASVSAASKNAKRH